MSTTESDEYSIRASGERSAASQPSVAHKLAEMPTVDCDESSLHGDVSARPSALHTKAKLLLEL